MSELKSYHKLIVWQRAKELLLLVYKFTESLPRGEEFGLKSQIRRAIVSVLSNITEGYLKRSGKEKAHFVEIAETSLMEVETQGEICFILGYWDQTEYDQFETKRREVAYLLYQYKKKVSSTL